MTVTSGSLVAMAADIVPISGKPPAKQIHTDPNDHQSGDQAHPWIQFFGNDVT